VKDYAFLKNDSGQFVCGFGPFREEAQAPAEGVAFYRNDFDLSDPRPWKVPARYVLGPDLSCLAAQVNGGKPPLIKWEALPSGVFQNVFEDIKKDIGSGALEKSVPVLTERGALLGGAMESLLHSVENLPASFFSYGWREGESGFLGASPELLFALHGRHLETMALAGTAASENSAEFEKDSKEIHEHEFVADYLVQKLNTLGQVRRESRQLLNLGRIAHFLTPIHVDLDVTPDVNDLIRLMHPTPALGASPKSKGTLDKLRVYRQQLEAPASFGAPFGVRVDGAFHSVVAIRNVSWDGSSVFLPAGCGVVQESSFENEWRELNLKRKAVKELLGL